MITSEFIGNIIVENEEVWVKEIINANYSYTISGIKVIHFIVDSLPYPIVKIDVLETVNNVKKVRCLTLFEDLRQDELIELSKYYPLNSMFYTNIGIIEIVEIL